MVGREAAGWAIIGLLFGVAAFAIYEAGAYSVRRHLVGKGRGRSSSEFDPDEVAMGVEHEMEHTDDPDLAEQIAVDHLAETPDYYSRLSQVED